MKLPFFDKIQPIPYDSGHYTPVIRCSICTGEQVAGFRENATGRIHDIMLIQSDRDLQRFCRQYGITQPIEKVY